MVLPSVGYIDSRWILTPFPQLPKLQMFARATYSKQSTSGQKLHQPFSLTALVTAHFWPFEYKFCARLQAEAHLSLSVPPVRVLIFRPDWCQMCPSAALPKLFRTWYWKVAIFRWQRVTAAALPMRSARERCARSNNSSSLSIHVRQKLLKNHFSHTRCRPHKGGLKIERRLLGLS